MTAHFFTRCPVVTTCFWQVSMIPYVLYVRKKNVPICASFMKVLCDSQCHKSMSKHKLTTAVAAPSSFLNGFSSWKHLLCTVNSHTWAQFHEFWHDCIWSMTFLQPFLSALSTSCFVLPELCSEVWINACQGHSILEWVGGFVAPLQDVVTRVMTCESRFKCRVNSLLCYSTSGTFLIY